MSRRRPAWPRWNPAAGGWLMLAALWVDGPAHAGDVGHGADLYRRHCTACHGASGRPVLPNAPDFTRTTALLRSDPDLLARIRDGQGAMPAYRGLLRDRDLLDIVAHLRTLK